MLRAQQGFYEFLDRPLFGKARVMLALSFVPLVLSFTSPLWRITLEAPQYPEGLYMEIYAYKLEGGNDGQHINEINTLNHYIGMRPLDRGALADLDWIPFAMGALVLITLRAAAIGNIRHLLDLAVLTTYVGAFSLGRFAYRLYVFGHNLDPAAPVKVKPFMPALLGSKEIANFTTYSYPGPGTYYLLLFILTMLGTLVWHLAAGRRRWQLQTSQS